MSSGGKKRRGGYISKANPPSPFSSRILCVHAVKRLGFILPLLYSLRCTMLDIISSRGEFWGLCHNWIGVLGCAKELVVSLPVSTLYVAFCSTLFTAVVTFHGAGGSCHDWYSTLAEPFVADGFIHRLRSTGERKRNPWTCRASRFLGKVEGLRIIMTRIRPAITQSCFAVVFVLISPVALVDNVEKDSR